jgi:DNA-binding SARP family transcriptional activator
MELRILGPIEAVDDSRSLALAGSRSRALLAALVVNPGVAVPRRPTLRLSACRQKISA